MPERTDSEYLLMDQYKDDSNLDARFRLHDHYSTNKYGWHRWVFDQFELPLTADILELGCGPGYFWQKNADRIPKGWTITLSDFSPGMIRQARQQLTDIHPFAFEVFDAQAIPFSARTFDAVIANHMLYHVPDLERAFSEISRVLKPDGKLYAATNGLNHFRELFDLVHSVMSEADLWFCSPSSGDNFNLEDGFNQLTAWFSKITLHRCENA